MKKRFAFMVFGVSLTFMALVAQYGLARAETFPLKAVTAWPKTALPSTSEKGN
jgi:hypothetical protein